MKPSELRHLANGLCRNGDGRPVANKGSRCRECMDKSNSYRNKAIEAGLCRSGDGRPLATSRLCRVCADKGAAKRSGYKMLPEERDRIRREVLNCQICGNSFHGAGNSPTAQCVDHDHYTGKIRGVLCGHCNKMIGLSKDRPAILLAAANYLLSHESKMMQNKEIIDNVEELKAA